MSKLVHNRVILDKNYISEKYTELKDKRTYFVADRVVISQIMLLNLTGLLTTLIIFLGIANTILNLWYVFLFIVPIVSIIITYIKRKSFYYNQHWLRSLLPLSVIWLSFTLYIGVFIDNFCGIEKTLWVGIFLSIFYIAGYLVAKVIRSIRFIYPKSTILWYFFIMSGALIIITLIGGYIILDSSLKANNINGLYREEYGEFSSCLPCIIGAFIMVSGIGIMLSVLLNYWMLQLLFENVKWNVETDPPNRLYFSCLIRSMIWMVLFWIALELFFPPIASKKGGRSRSGRSRHSSGGGNKAGVAATTQRKKLVDQEWEKQNLGDSNSEEKITEVIKN
ncbi:MAG: hypothetical protein ACFFHV_06030 [Promethearchaeota archaeon]